MENMTLSIPEELKKKLAEFKEMNWSAVAREAFLKKTKQLEMLKKLESKEEQEFIKWSVELGRKAKKESFKRLLSELSTKERAELVSAMSPKQKADLGL